MILTGSKGAVIASLAAFTIVFVTCMTVMISHTSFKSNMTPIDGRIKRISVIAGWRNYYAGGEPNTARCKTEKHIYSCEYDYDDLKLSPDRMSDLVVFHEGGLSDKPPVKFESQLWVFRSGESQRRLSIKDTKYWDGYFNYTYDVRRDATSQGYVNEVRVRDRKLYRNFYQEKIKALNQTKLSPSAIWFVSNCHTDEPFLVTSARAEYANKLSEWNDISAYTRRDACKDNEYIRPLLKDRAVEPEPPIDDFPFYLSFENSLCEDYITEKMWKILQGDALTIPVVLGGLDINNYESIAPSNSYIHVRNFTSPHHLAKHLKFVAENEWAFNYYLQWRNEYELYSDDGDMYCKMCVLAWERPQSVFNMSTHFNQSQCLDVSRPKDYRSYYNLPC